GLVARSPLVATVACIGRLAVALVASAALLAVLGSPPPSLAGPSSETAGLSVPADRAAIKGMTGHWWHLARYGDRLLDEYARLGVSNVRLSVDWVLIEPAEGQRSWASLDAIMAGFRNRGIEVLPVISSVVPWASTNPEACARSALSCLPDRDKTTAFEETVRQI